MIVNNVLFGSKLLATELAVVISEVEKKVDMDGTKLDVISDDD